MSRLKDLQDWMDASEHDNDLVSMGRIFLVVIGGICALLIAFGLAVTVLVAVFGDGTDYGRCLDWHVVHSKGSYNVCDVWEFPNGRGEHG